MEISMRDLLEAGVHFGHQTRRWNPKMARYIFMERNDIYILDLQKTIRGLRRAGKFLADVVRTGGRVLFVSTKKQAQEIIESEARRGNAFYVTQRWLGGMLTNFTTISKRIKHLKSLEKMQEDGVFDVLGKKEEARLRKQKARLEKYLSGIKEMRNLPDAVFVVDPRREAIAVKEARKLRIPVVAIVDTNCDPDEVDHVIPGNDDAIRSIRVITSYLAGCMAESLALRQPPPEVAVSEEADGQAPEAAAEPAPAAEPEKAKPRTRTRTTKTGPRSGGRGKSKAEAAAEAPAEAAEPPAETEGAAAPATEETPEA